MRILIYNWRDLKHPLAGGAEVYTDAVASEWVKMGHSVTLFCAAVEYEPEREFSAHGYEIVRRGSRHGVYREAKKYWRTEGKGNFDLVIDEVNTRPFFCSSFVIDVSVIVLIHQVAREVWFYESAFPMAVLGRYILEPWWLWRIRNADIVTVSKSSKLSLERYGLKNVRVVPEGFELKERPIVNKEVDPTLVFLGRLSANKRPGDAIEAFEIVKRTIPNAKMWVIGDGPERARLERRNVDGVEFLGRLSESEKLERLSIAHLLVVTSVREGWGLVVTEAAHLGMPTIGYDVPGLRDSILASAGALSPPDPASLGALLVSLIPVWFASPPNVRTGGVAIWKYVASRVIEQQVVLSRRRSKSDGILATVLTLWSSGIG